VNTVYLRDINFWIAVLVVSVVTGLVLRMVLR